MNPPSSLVAADSQRTPAAAILLVPMSQRPAIENSQTHPGIRVASGDWTLSNAGQMLALLREAPESAQGIDGRGISRLDSAGAMLLSRYAVKLGTSLASVPVQPAYQSLAQTVQAICENPPRKVRKDYGVEEMLARMGYAVEDYAREILALVGFLGLSLKTGLGVALRPLRFRVTPTVHHMEQVGLDAVPLVILLSFMVGAVIAFLGATVLRDFGAEIFVVELVSIAFLREFGVLLTAILLAGRTASAFTAQIGAMQSGEEIDAIRTLGLDPIELLVIPRLVALLVMLPLLTFLAMISGILGGMAVSLASLGMTADMFVNRLYETLSITHFWVGMSKAPIFALVIGLIGCLEGFQVKGTAQSVGERTTSSVVQSISLVIILDALAALFFLEMDW